MKTNLWQGTWEGRLPKGDRHKRSREVVRPTGGIVRGKFPSRKNGRMVHHEGLLELDAIYLFEASPEIACFREQPSAINYPDGAKLRRYTPDFELVLTSGEIVLVEVKPTFSLKNEEVKRTFGCITNHLRRSRESFVILTEESIRQEPYLSNIKLIYHRASRVPPSEVAGAVATQRCRQHFPLSIHATAGLLSEFDVDPYSLLMAGHLRCGLEQTISLDTQIDLATEEDHGWFWISEEYGF